jgi:hypothetical protein
MFFLRCRYWLSEVARFVKVGVKSLRRSCPLCWGIGALPPQIGIYRVPRHPVCGVCSHEPHNRGGDSEHIYHHETTQKYTPTTASSMTPDGSYDDRHSDMVPPLSTKAAPMVCLNGSPEKPRRILRLDTSDTSETLMSTLYVLPSPPLPLFSLSDHGSL